MRFTNRLKETPEGAWSGGPEPYSKKIEHDDQPLTRVFVTMLQQLGMKTDTFAGATGDFPELLS